MLTQLKLALRILRRRKFFTFISLFGISFTIMALVVIAAMGDAALGDNPPLGNRDRLVFATSMYAQTMVPDTTYLIDSSEVDGRMVYDSTEQIGERQQGNSNGGLSYYVYDAHLRNLEGVALSTHTNPTPTFDAYLDGRKVTLSANYTDADYWRLFDFRFVAGRPFSAEQVVSGERVAVLSARAAEDYFGTADATVVGRTMDLGEDEFRVIGIVETVTTTVFGLESDVFIPFTTSTYDFTEPTLVGGGGGVFLMTDGVSRTSVVLAIKRAADAMQSLPGDERNRFTIEGLTFFEEVADSYLQEGYNRARSFQVLAPIISVLLLLLVLLPALNLVNVNLSRAYERASEIAVRKSFGASDTAVLRQFLIETLVVTAIGTALGALLGYGLISLINAEYWLGDVRIAYTPRVLLVTAALVFTLTLLTGVLPALRLARTRIATSLR